MKTASDMRAILLTIGLLCVANVPGNYAFFGTGRGTGPTTPAAPSSPQTAAAGIAQGVAQGFGNNSVATTADSASLIDNIGSISGSQFAAAGPVFQGAFQGGSSATNQNGGAAIAAVGTEGIFAGNLGGQTLTFSDNDGISGAASTFAAERVGAANFASGSAVRGGVRPPPPPPTPSSTPPSTPPSTPTSTPPTSSPATSVCPPTAAQCNFPACAAIPGCQQCQTASSGNGIQCIRCCSGWALRNNANGQFCDRCAGEITNCATCNPIGTGAATPRIQCTACCPGFGLNFQTTTPAPAQPRCDACSAVRACTECVDANPATFDGGTAGDLSDDLSCTICAAGFRVDQSATPRNCITI